MFFPRLTGIAVKTCPESRPLARVGDLSLSMRKSAVEPWSMRRSGPLWTDCQREAFASLEGASVSKQYWLPFDV